jgi:hypothetical protein
MKKALLCLIAIGSTIAVSAQVTITSADFPAIYTVIREANDTMPSVTTGAAGANQTWNYSALANHRVDTTTFTLPQFTPYASTYPTSNYALAFGANGGYAYADFSSAAVNILGQAVDPFGTGIVALTFDNPEQLAAFPAAYGGNELDTATGGALFYLGIDPGIGFVIDSVRIHTWVKRTSDYDAWGAVTTPTGTYNVLRQNSLRVQYDTIDIYAFGGWVPNFFSQQDSNRVYSHWANGTGNVCELTEAEDLGQVTSAKYLLTSAVIGISENNGTAQINSFPNPANEQISFATAGTAVRTIVILNTAGQIVETLTVNSDITRLNLENYASGIYFFQALDQNGISKTQGKFTVAH